MATESSSKHRRTGDVVTSWEKHRLSIFTHIFENSERGHFFTSVQSDRMVVVYITPGMCSKLGSTTRQLSGQTHQRGAPCQRRADLRMMMVSNRGLTPEWWESLEEAATSGIIFERQFITRTEDGYIRITAKFDPVEIENEKYIITSCTSHAHKSPVRCDFEPLPIDFQQFLYDAVIESRAMHNLLEVDMVAKDILIHHATENLAQTFYDSAADTITNRWVYRDIGFAKEKIIWLAESLSQGARIGSINQIANSFFCPGIGMYKDVVLSGACCGAIDRETRLWIPSEQVESHGNFNFIFTVTVKENTESSLESQKEFNTDYMAFFNLALTPLCLVEMQEDDSVLFHMANAAFARMSFDSSPDLIKGRNSKELSWMTTMDVIKWIRDLKSNYNEKNNLSVFQNSYHVLGREMILQTKAQRMDIGQGSHGIWSCAQTDVTVFVLEQDKLEKKVQERTKELDEALQTKNRFLTTMSHEIRTPLSGLVGSISHFSEKSDLNEEDREVLEIGHHCGDQLLTVINDVLDLSKIEANQVILERRPVIVQAVLEASVDVVTIHAAKKGLPIIMECDFPLDLQIYSDHLRLRQIMVNLISNAIKFTEKGEIYVFARVRGGDQLEISVKDSGIGIRHSFKKKIFQPFVQSDPSITRKFGGSGLGLSICQRLVEAMQGSISVESIEGQGSTFSFHVRLERCTELSQDAQFLGSTERKVIQSNEKKKKNALVLEGNHKQLNVLMRTLYRLGFQCEGKTRVDDSLEEEKWAGNLTPDVIFVDMELDGVEKVLHRFPGIPILSLENLIVGVPRTKRPGTLGVLRKPIRRRQLAQTLHGILYHGCVTVNSQPDQPSPKIELKPIKCLVAEDNPINQKVILRMLKKLGIQADCVDNGKSAVEWVQKHRVDLILMDCNMPIMGGIQATEMIRALPHFQPRIVALTADAMSNTRFQCLDAGMSDVMTKPITTEQLQQVIQQTHQR
ncbi:putative two-component hybrid sensor and regulator [Planoprotostelium fungivorum]|uniref:Putative two-component hybrid sensor and regulator n=1 Tax=Planoprotostelium fungivorum TaxID=1890364 RepID=A0A2P6MPB0_9EUKA|nr:putative two-component hybrid sensor and regulator [Planoprotostelium fungivorum]